MQMQRKNKMQQFNQQKRLPRMRQNLRHQTLKRRPTKKTMLKN